MKLISFVIPCYNSESFMKKCIDSLLIGGEDVEIIIINDGSKDNTGKIADEYQKKYPKIVRAVHQENGGHGEVINHGLKLAKGKYFKVIDSDDWVDEDAYKTLLSKLKDIDADLVINNYVYSHANGKKQPINFSNIFPNDKVCTWKDIKKFKMTQYLSLHSLMYKKSVLDKTSIELPKHISYDDNLFIYLPFINTETLYYLDVDFYQYFIGREGQSVSAENLVKKSPDQVIVSKLVCNAYDLDEVKNNKKLYKVMLRECIFMMTIGVVFSRMLYNDAGEKAYKDLWASVKENNPKLYKKMRHFTMASLVSIPGPLGRAIGVGGYKIAHKLVDFN